MLRTAIVTLSILSLWPADGWAFMGDDADWSRVDLPGQASKLLPDNGEVLASVSADLNGDGSTDYLVVFEFLDNTRELFVIIKQGEKFKIASTSSRAILRKTEGGMAGDPFMRIRADKKQFGIQHSGGSASSHWRTSATFGYSRRDKKWQLVHFAYSADVPAADEETKADDKEYKPKDFGLINLEEYDLGLYMSEKRIAPVRDDEVEANKQEPGEAVARTGATASSKYSTSRPEQLKHRELLDFNGGPFLETDGKRSFKNSLSPFQIGKDYVTYELWFVVKKWAQSKGYRFQMDGGTHGSRQGGLPEKDSSLEVRGISWRDAIVWCNAYSEMMGLKPFYYSNPQLKNPIRSSVFGAFFGKEDGRQGSFDNPYVDWLANGYRLPTEGEWLFAMTYIDGKKWRDPGSQTVDAGANGITYKQYTTEWLWDWYGDFPVRDCQDYRGPQTGAPRVLHGGFDPDSGANPNALQVISIGRRLSEYPLVCFSYNSFRVARNK